MALTGHKVHKKMKKMKKGKKAHKAHKNMKHGKVRGGAVWTLNEGVVVYTDMTHVICSPMYGLS